VFSGTLNPTHFTSPLYFIMVRPFPSPQNCLFVWGIWTSIEYTVSLAQPSPQPKRHLDRFSRFAGLMIVTDRPTDRPRYSVCNNRPHLRSLRCGVIITDPAACGKSTFSPFLSGTCEEITHRCCCDPRPQVAIFPEKICRIRRPYCMWLKAIEADPVETGIRRRRQRVDAQQIYLQLDCRSVKQWFHDKI